MAKDPKKTVVESGEGQPKSKKKLFLIIIVAVLALGLGGGGAAWYFLMGPGHGPEKKEEAHPEPVKPIFMTLETFTVNLADEGRFLQVGVDLRVANEKVIEEAKLHMPEIRNGILLLLSSKQAEEMGTVEGKQKLAAEILEQVNKPLGVKDPKEGATGVFFTSFVIQ